MWVRENNGTGAKAGPGKGSSHARLLRTRECYLVPDDVSIQFQVG